MLSYSWSFIRQFGFAMYHIHLFYDPSLISSSTVPVQTRTLSISILQTSRSVILGTSTVGSMQPTWFCQADLSSTSGRSAYRSALMTLFLLNIIWGALICGCIQMPQGYRMPSTSILWVTKFIIMSKRDMSCFSTSPRWASSGIRPTVQWSNNSISNFRK